MPIQASWISISTSSSTSKDKSSQEPQEPAQRPLRVAPPPRETPCLAQTGRFAMTVRDIVTVRRSASQQDGGWSFWLARDASLPVVARSPPGSL